MENFDQGQRVEDAMDLPLDASLFPEENWNDGAEEMDLEEDLSQQLVELPPQPEDLSQQLVDSAQQNLKRKRILLAEQIMIASQQLRSDSKQSEMTLKIVSKAFSG